MAELSRGEYARRYGPTTGDRVRLGDTDLWVEVEADHVGFGDEPLWGYGKNIRSRMTQSDRVTVVARTLTRTSSSFGTGRSTSSRRRTSGDPYRSWTTAFMSG